MDNGIKGSCVCGDVKFSVCDQFKYVGFCHCTDCRKFSGSAFSSFGGISKSLLKISQGEEAIGRYEKGSDSILCFCTSCGSSLFSDKPISGLVHIRLGTLEESPSKRPQLHIFTSSRVDWHEISDDLPQFDKMPPPS